MREVRLEVSNWVAGAYAFLRYGRDLYAVDAMSGDGSRLQVLRDGLSSFRVIAPGDGTFSSVFFNATVQTPGSLCQQCDADHHCGGGGDRQVCNALMVASVQSTNVSACFCVELSKQWST